MRHYSIVSTQVRLSNQDESAKALLSTLSKASSVEELLELSTLLNVSIDPSSSFVDLNSASPDLLQTLLNGYDITPQQSNDMLTKYYAWRQQGHRLLRTSDFFRITQLDPSIFPNFENYTTVYSGKSGLSFETVSDDLIEHLHKGQTGPDLENMFNSNPSFQIVHVIDPADNTHIGVISIGDASRILEY